MAGQLAQLIASAPLPGDAQEMLGRAVAEVRAWDAGGQASTSAASQPEDSGAVTLSDRGDEGSKIIEVDRGRRR